MDRPCFRSRAIHEVRRNDNSFWTDQNINRLNPSTYLSDQNHDQRDRNSDDSDAHSDNSDPALDSLDPDLDRFDPDLDQGDLNMDQSDPNMDRGDLRWRLLPGLMQG